MDETPAPFPGRGLAWLAFVAAAAVAWAGPLFLPLADTWWHLLQVHRCAQSGAWLPMAPDGAIRLHAGVWHGALGHLCRATGWHPLEAWTFAAPWVAAGWVLAFGWLTRRLLGPGREVAGALAALLVFNGSFIDPLRELSYPRYVNLIHLALGLAFACDWIARGRRRDLAGVALCGLAMAAVHLQELVLFGMTLGFALPALFVARRASFSQEGGRVIAAGLAALAGAAPYFALVVVPYMLPRSDALSAAVPLELRLRDTLAVGGRWMLDPAGEFGRIAGGAAVAATLALPLWWPHARARPGTALLAGALVAPPAIALNPLVFPVFLKVWPVADVVHRIALAMLTPWAALAAGAALVTRVTLPGLAGRAVALALLALLCAGAWPAIALRARDLAAPAWRAELARLTYLRPLAGRLERGDPVLTDPYTSYHLAGLWGLEPFELGTSRDANHDRRPLSPVYRFFRDPTQPHAELTRALAGVRWVVVNASREPASFETAAHRDPFTQGGAPSWLSANRDVFSLRLDADGLTLYEVSKILPAAFAGKGLPADAARPRLEAPDPDARTLGAVGIFALALPASPRVVTRGETLAVPLRLRLTAPASPYVRLRVHALATARPTAPALGKPGRKLYELIARQTWRFGDELEIVPEELQAVVLPAGTELAYRLALPVPAHAAPGTYRLALELLPKPVSAVRAVTFADEPLPGLDAGTFTVR